MSKSKVAKKVEVTEAPKKGVITEALEAAAEKEVSKKKAAGATPAASGVVYKLGEAKYNPRVEHNQQAWEKVVTAITIKGKGKASHGDLCSVLATHFVKVEENHHDFIGYMVRRGSLISAK